LKSHCCRALLSWLHVWQAAEVERQNCMWWQEEAKPTTNQARSADVEAFWERARQSPAEVRGPQGQRRAVWLWDLSGTRRR
jgi:hypothetical protein